MAQHEVTRTLVKSQPEVWTQCSDADSLGRHLSGSFGEIRITRLEPEHSVAWEGEEVSGTVRIEPSAWGTRVTLTVEMADEVAALEEEISPPARGPEPEAEPEPTAQEPVQEEPISTEPEAAPRVWARFRAWLRAEPMAEPEREMEPDLEMEPDDHAEPDLAPEATPRAEEPLEAEPPPIAPEADPAPPSDAAVLLAAALESLGQAHHRPYSRA